MDRHNKSFATLVHERQQLVLQSIKSREAFHEPQTQASVRQRLRLALNDRGVSPNIVPSSMRLVNTLRGQAVMPIVTRDSFVCYCTDDPSMNDGSQYLSKDCSFLMVVTGTFMPEQSCVPGAYSIVGKAQTVTILYTCSADWDALGAFLTVFTNCKFFTL